MHRPLTIAVGLIAAFAALAVPAEAATVQVTIAKMAFTPTEIKINAGDTIEWINNDFVAHTATARDKSFDIVIPAHGTGTLTLTTAGRFDFYCRFHPMMKGTIEVGGN